MKHGDEGAEGLERHALELALQHRVEPREQVLAFSVVLRGGPLRLDDPPKLAIEPRHPLRGGSLAPVAQHERVGGGEELPRVREELRGGGPGAGLDLVVAVGLVRVVVVVIVIVVVVVAVMVVAEAGEEIVQRVRARVVRHVAPAIVVAVAKPASGRAPRTVIPALVAGCPAVIVVPPMTAVVMGHRLVPERYSPANGLSNRLLVPLVAHPRGHAQQIVREQVGEVIPRGDARRHPRAPKSRRALRARPRTIGRSPSAVAPLF